MLAAQLVQVTDFTLALCRTGANAGCMSVVALQMTLLGCKDGQGHSSAHGQALTDELL